MAKPFKPKCKHLKTCKYAMHDCGSRMHCGYILITDKPRGCPADKCDKYERKKKGEKNRSIDFITGSYQG